MAAGEGDARLANASPDVPAGRDDASCVRTPHWLGTAILSIVMALLFSVGTIAATASQYGEDSHTLEGATYFVVFTFLFWALFRGFDRILPRLLERRSQRTSWGPFGMDGSALSVARNWAVVLVCWLPYLILPGVILAWDTGDQIASYLGVSTFGFEPGVLYAHHPVFDTLLYGKLAKIGIDCFGSVAVPLHALAYAQAFAGAGALVMFVRELVTRVGDTWASRALLLAIALFPMVPAIFVTIVKDSTNMAVFLWWLWLYSRFAARRFSRPRVPELLALCALTLLCCLTKKTSLYVIAATVALSLLLVRPTARGIMCVLATLLLPLLVQSVLWEGLYLGRYNVSEGDSQSAFTPLLQMMARAAYENPNVLNDAEKQTFNENVSGVTWEQLPSLYVPYSSDPCFWYPLYAGEAPNAKDFSAGEVLLLWAKLVRRAPGSMLRGYLSLESGWVSFVNCGAYDSWPEKGAAPCQQTFQAVWKTGANQGVWEGVATYKDIKMTEGGRQIQYFIETLEQVPVVNIPFYICVWTSVLPAYLLRRLLAVRSGTRTAVSLPVLLSVAVLFLSPVSIQVFRGGPSPTRYGLCAMVLMLVAPALLAMASMAPAGGRPLALACRGGALTRG